MIGIPWKIDVSEYIYIDGEEYLLEDWMTEDGYTWHDFINSVSGNIDITTDHIIDLDTGYIMVDENQVPVIWHSSPRAGNYSFIDVPGVE